jgi:hypothetical protein
MSDIQLAIYTTSVTTRLRYTFDLLFKDLLGTGYRFISSAEEFKKYSGPKISYGDHPLDDEIFIYAAKLLFEKGI